MLEAPAMAAPAQPLDGRPTKALPLRQLLQLSIYWFGLTSIWSALDTIVLPQRMIELVGPDGAGRAVAAIRVLGAIVAVLVQPTVGSISDYTMSRWGRRKPYILIGSALDLFILVALANANTFLAILGLYLLLQFSSNFAQGPFQGYVPDLVPARQVSLASALVGAMQVLGPIGGAIIASTGFLLSPPDHPDFRLPLIALGVLEFATALVTVITVDEGRAANERGGRSWFEIAAETWGLDILRERSFLWLIGSRFFVLSGISMLLSVVLFYLGRSIGLRGAELGFWLAVTPIIIGVCVLVSTGPAAILSDRFGRKQMIYGCCVVGAAGMAVAAAAPSIQVAVVGAILVGVAAGAFVSVDWALMTDIIPKASSGRFMGLSNLATGSAGALSIILGGTIVDLVDGSVGGPLGPRVAYALGVVLFAIGAVLLRPVDPRRREDAPTLEPSAR
jgi:MFS family permease